MSKPNSFTQPGLFRRMNVNYLHAWLLPWRDYFERRKFAIPENAAGWIVDYEHVAAIFMEPDAETPRRLMHAACLIAEMANENAMQDLLEGLRREHVELDLGDDPDAADVAVQVWLHDSDLLEELHNLHQLDRPRSFMLFSTDQHPVPEFRVPSDVRITDLEAELAQWNFKMKRGLSARVWMYQRPQEYWFLVRHGLTSRRQEVISPSGCETLILRPGEYDVLVYNCERGELRIHGCNAKEVEMLRRTFGEYLFGNPEFFPGGAKFTLAPLVMDGPACLACVDVPEIASITLTGVQFFGGGRDWLRETYESPDIFAKVATGAIKFPTPDRVVRATFLVRFKDSKKQRTVTIHGSNRLKVVRDGDTVAVERWLAARGFVLEPAHDEIETGTLAST